MGNIVALNALKLQADADPTKKLVHAFVASQAAVAAEAFDAAKGDGHLTIYSNFIATGKPFFSNIASAADQLINFFNPNDYALNSATTWLLNQHTKPDSGYVEANPLTQPGAGPFARKGAFLGQDTVLDPGVLAERYEIFSFAASPHGLALGAQQGVGGPFTAAKEVDLSAPPYSFTGRQWDHSAEFNGDYATRSPYWKTMLKNFDITGWI